MQYSQEHLKTMVYAEFGGQTECIMGNSKIENVVFVVVSHYQLPSSYIFALTSMSFRDLPLLWDMIGGLLKIVFSSD